MPEPIPPDNGDLDQRLGRFRCREVAWALLRDRLATEFGLED